MRNVSVLLALCLVACSGDDAATPDSGGGSDTGGALGGIGDPCQRTRECMTGLYCSRDRVCAQAGTLGVGEACDTTAECMAGLVCAMGVLSRTCQQAGDGDVGDPCVTDTSCLAGLYCVDNMCSATPPTSNMDGGIEDAGERADIGPGRPCSPDGGTCDDDSACTVDQCVSNLCRNTIIDGDEDGYASVLIEGSCGRDCNDMDDTVNPDHTDWETTRHDPPNPLQPPSFDWNCDGMIELEFPSRVPDCDDMGVCTMGEGWAGSVPTCGQMGTWARCSGTPLCNVTNVETRQQRCR